MISVNIPPMKVLILVFTVVFITLSCATQRYGVYHKVEKGETLYGIAGKYQIKVDKLKEVNSIDDEKSLKVGRYLLIPDVKAPENVTDSVPSNKNKESSTSFVKKPADNKGNEKVSSSVKFDWPVDGVVTSLFGPRNGKMHEGIDIGVPVGRTITASANGKVIFSGTHGGYGKVIIIQHKDGYVTIYAHNSKLLKKEGESVKKGEKIAVSGKTGRATGPHLHFEIRKNSKPVDPLKYLPGKVVP